MQTGEELDVCRHCKESFDACDCTTLCNHCEAQLPDHEIEDGETHCEYCREEDAKLAWIETTETEVERLAADAGWEIDAWNGGFNTKSRYAEIWREVGDEIESFKVRVSDHGSCYCSEDISLAMEPGGDDHTLDVLAARLARPFEAD